MISTILMLIIIIISIAGTTVLIEQTQEDSQLTGKLKHNPLVVALNQISFLGFIAIISNLYWTVLTAIILVATTVNLFNIPFDLKYNYTFAKNLRAVTLIKSVLLLVVILAEVVF